MGDMLTLIRCARLISVSSASVSEVTGELNPEPV